MAEKKQPWMKWYPADWRSEPGLRMVSRAARSLWMDMLGLMHEAEPYGELRLNGRPLKAAGIAALLGDRVSDVSRWLLELKVAGVSSENSDGVIFSRRMVRDRAKALKDKENGGRGGNPRLKPGVNPQDNAGDKAQKLEARDQKPESNARADDWPRVWAAFLAWPKMPATATEARARAVYDRMAAELPATDALVAEIEAQGARLRVMGALATAPHNWLERDRGWAEGRAANLKPIDTSAMRAAWGGEADRLIANLGVRGEALFASWFAMANFEAGPPARIVLPNDSRRVHVREKFDEPLRKTFGDYVLEVRA